MFLQTRFDNDAKEPYKDICCESCWTARKEKCTCRCGGTYHGLGNNRGKLGGEEVVQFDGDIPVTTCRWCGTSLADEPVLGYPHYAGWTVKGHDTKMWLYQRCPKCRYDWALWKLGITRETE